MTSTSADQQDLIRRRYDFVSLADIPDLAVNPEDELWGGIVFRGAVTLIAGHAGIGKTTFARGVAYSVATGAAYCSFSGPVGGKPVLYLDYETAGGFRLARWKRVCGDDLSAMRMLYVNDWYDRFDAVSVVEEVRQKDAALVVVDTLIKATLPDNENDNAEMTRIMESFDYVAREAHCAVLVITHRGKSQSGGPRGASAIGASASVVATFEREKADDKSGAAQLAYKITIEKNRYGSDETIHLVRDGDGGYQLASDVDGGTERRRAEAIVLEILSQADQPVQRNELVRRMSARMAVECPRAPAERTLERAIDDLYERGQIRRPSRGLYEKSRPESQP